MGDKWIELYNMTPLIRHKKLNRRMLRRLSTSCRYCTGFEDKIIKKDTDPVHKEVADMERHEIISFLGSCMGDSPMYLTKAEKVFDEIKYSITEYVLKHEFNEESGLSVQVALWLEKRKEPALYQPLEYVINKYLKPNQRNNPVQLNTK
ncbi:MAG: hypothetical protein OEV66_04290 [Spirochaetia bacterium]|nr:hypothetical protein [Spirochaetia bacterium]